MPISSFGGTLLLGELAPGTYLLTVGGWDDDQAADISYQLSLAISFSTNDNAPPLVSGPTPAVAIRFDTVARSSSDTSTAGDVSTQIHRRRSRHRRAAPPTPRDDATDRQTVDGSRPFVTHRGSAQPEITIELPSRSEDGTDLSGASSLGLVVLSTSSVGGVIGIEGAQAGSAQLVQSATAISPSSVTAGLIVLGTSFPLPGLGREVGATPPGPEGIEEEVTTAEVARVDIVPLRLPEMASWLTATVRELLVDAAMSHPSALDAPITPEVSSLVSAGLADDALDAPHVRSADLSAGLEEHLDGCNWGRVWSFVIASTGLATVLYTRCRGHRRRAEGQGEGSRRVLDPPSPDSSSRSVLGDRLRGFRSPGLTSGDTHLGPFRRSSPWGVRGTWQAPTMSLVVTDVSPAP